MIRVSSAHTFSFRYTLFFVGAEGMCCCGVFGFCLFRSVGFFFLKKGLSYLLAWAYY